MGSGACRCPPSTAGRSLHRPCSLPACRTSRSRRHAPRPGRRRALCGPYRMCPRLCRRARRFTRFLRPQPTVWSRAGGTRTAIRFAASRTSTRHGWRTRSTRRRHGPGATTTSTRPTRRPTCPTRSPRWTSRAPGSRPRARSRAALPRTKTRARQTHHRRSRCRRPQIVSQAPFRDLHACARGPWDGRSRRRTAPSRICHRATCTSRRRPCTHSARMPICATSSRRRCPWRHARKTRRARASRHRVQTRRATRPLSRGTHAVRAGAPRPAAAGRLRCATLRHRPAP